MTKLSTVGITIIVVGFLPLIAKDIYEPIKDYLVKELPILSSEPIILTIISAIIGGIIGSILITNDRYHWIEKTIHKNNIIDKIYDSKKLNREVFKKLVCISCFEHFQFFRNNFGFCISLSPIKFDVWKFFEFYARPENNDELKNIEKDIVPIEEAIPTLQIGEHYLEKNYHDVYLEWIRVKQELENLNKERHIFFKKVSSKINKNLKKEFKSTPKQLLVPFGDDWAYFEGFVLLVLPLLFRMHTIPKLDVDGIENQHYICYSGLRLVGFNKLPVNAVETVKLVFNRIISDQELRSESGNFYVQLYSINEKLHHFSKEIETKVVNDIDNIL